MPEFKVLFGDEYDDEIFDSEEEAENYAIDMAACIREGAEELFLSNPGDYDEYDYDDEYEIVEIDD